MRYQADDRLAMVLPIPTAVDATEGSVRWINLEGQSDLFVLLERLFPPPPAAQPVSRAPAPAALPVVRVGSFWASFAPTARDLGRLDPVFRLDPALIRSDPLFSARGFVVAQLAADATTIHPLAFSFPRRDPTRLFFPTLHVHDGSLPPRATFDHTLYTQASRATTITGGFPAEWAVSVRNPGPELARDEALVRAGAPVHRLRLVGTFPNVDLELAAG
jgi:hypothetical protein